MDADRPPPPSDGNAPERGFARFLACLALLAALGAAVGLGLIAWRSIAQRRGPPYLDGAPKAAGQGGPIQSVVHNDQGMFVWATGDGAIRFRVPWMDRSFDMQHPAPPRCLTAAKEVARHVHSPGLLPVVVAFKWNAEHVPVQTQ